MPGLPFHVNVTNMTHSVTVEIKPIWMTLKRLDAGSAGKVHEINL
jgi:hypothetical protein